MSEYEMQDLEYDNTDLGQTSGQFNLPAPRPIESLSALTTRIDAKQNFPKDDMRRLWVKKSSEREKAMKQLRDIDSKLEYWISKRKFTIEVIQDCERTLQKLDVAIMSDIMSC